MNVAAKGRGATRRVDKGRESGGRFLRVRRSRVLQVSRSLRKIKIWRAIQRQASGPCIKGVLTGVSRGKKAETGKERRGTKAEEHKREMRTPSWQTLRRDAKDESMRSHRLDYCRASLTMKYIIGRKIGKVKINF